MSPVQKTAILDGVEIAYFDMDPSPDAEKGSEPQKTIILIHGFASSASVNWIGTGWAKLLNDNGYRVIALDNRGHGNSQKFYTPEDYGPDIFARDVFALLDYLNVQTCDVMGYSMGARITCWMCHAAPTRVNRAIFGGLGAHIFGGRGGYDEIAAGLETDDITTITDKGALSFRKFADATGSDRLALAACIRQSKRKITPEMVANIHTPVLVAVGSEDTIGGSAVSLAEAMPNARAAVLEGLDHMKATGATAYKKSALEFLTGDRS